LFDDGLGIAGELIVLREALGFGEFNGLEHAEENIDDVLFAIDLDDRLAKAKARFGGNGIEGCSVDWDWPLP
jgi:hypothetical protein